MRPDQQTEYIVQCLRDSGSMYEDDARKFLAEHDAHVRATALAEVGKPAVDESFFVPGRVYTRTLRTGAHSPRPIHLRFLCRHIDSDPVVGDREAWGWVLRSDGTRRRDFFFDHDYPLWTIEAGDTRG